MELGTCTQPSGVTMTWRPPSLNPMTSPSFVLPGAFIVAMPTAIESYVVGFR